MKKLAAVMMLLFVVLGSVVALAGDNPNAPKTPKYIWVQTEQFQAGKHAAYSKLGLTFKEAMAKTEFTWLAATPVTGNGNEVTYVMFPDSFASIDKTMAAFMKAGEELAHNNPALETEGASAVEHSRSFLAEFQPELSTLSDKVPPAQATRWEVTVYRLKPGFRLEFADFLKEQRALREKAGDQAPVLVYWVTAGEPLPAYIEVVPAKTLADFDEPPLPAYKALVTPLMREHVYNTIKKMVADVERTIFMVNPSLSLPPKSYLAENPGFWVVKQPEAAVAATGKKAKKAVEPAAIKEKEKK